MKRMILILAVILAIAQTALGSGQPTASSFTLTIAGTAIPISGPTGVSFVNISSAPIQQAFVTWNQFIPGVTIPASATTAASGGTIYTFTVAGSNLAKPSSMTIGINTPCGIISVQDSIGTEFYLTACIATQQQSGCVLPFSDNFQIPNGPLGSNYTVAPVGSITIATNTAGVQPFSSVKQIAFPNNCNGWTGSQYALISNVHGDINARFGTTVNTIDPSNYYFVECTVQGCGAGTMIAGKSQFIANFVNGPNAIAPAAGGSVCLELSAGVLKLKVSGTYATNTIPVSGLTGIGGGGLYFAGQGAVPASAGGFQTGLGKCTN